MEVRQVYYVRQLHRMFNVSNDMQLLMRFHGICMIFMINKYKPTTVPKTCPHCLMEEETMNHFIGQCPKWSYQRGGYFDSFYLSVTDIVDKFSLPRIIGFIQATKRFTKCGEDKA